MDDKVKTYLGDLTGDVQGIKYIVVNWYITTSGHKVTVTTYQVNSFSR